MERVPASPTPRCPASAAERWPQDLLEWLGNGRTLECSGIQMNCLPGRWLTQLRSDEMFGIHLNIHLNCLLKMVPDFVIQMN